VLSVSTALTLLAQQQQQRIALPIDTSPDMLITTVKLGRSSDLKDLGDLRGWSDLEDLKTKLNQYRDGVRWRLTLDGELICRDSDSDPE
jgi:hypothetical protein